jgi:serine/threonine protein kinase
VNTQGKRACQVCGTALSGDSDLCPVCALQGALKPKSDSCSDISSEFRFEHYQVLKNEDGIPIELGHGAMGVTYKAFDVHLERPVALKIINARFIGDDSARHRFVREARAAGSVRHPNVASVFHLGEAGGNYFYAMEFVEGETLEKLIQRSGLLETDVALEVVGQVAAGLTAIHKQHLVHRDIKPSNIMVSLEHGRLESAKIIDLGEVTFPRLFCRADVPASICCASERKIKERSSADYRVAGNSAGQRSRPTFSRAGSTAEGSAKSERSD